MLAVSRAPMTVDEWAALDEEVPGELLNGHLEAEEVPSIVHECVVRWLILLLAPYFEARGGQVFGSGVRSFEIWELDANAHYVRMCSATSGRLERVPACEGLTVDVGALWAQVDRLFA